MGSLEPTPALCVGGKKKYMFCIFSVRLSVLFLIFSIPLVKLACCAANALILQFHSAECQYARLIYVSAPKRIDFYFFGGGGFSVQVHFNAQVSPLKATRLHTELLVFFHRRRVFHCRKVACIRLWWIYGDKSVSFVLTMPGMVVVVEDKKQSICTSIRFFVAYRLAQISSFETLSVKM